VVARNGDVGCIGEINGHSSGLLQLQVDEGDAEVVDLLRSYFAHARLELEFVLIRTADVMKITNGMQFHVPAAKVIDIRPAAGHVLQLLQGAILRRRHDVVTDVDGAIVRIRGE